LRRYYRASFRRGRAHSVPVQRLFDDECISRLCLPRFRRLTDSGPSSRHGTDPPAGERLRENIRHDQLRRLALHHDRRSAAERISRRRHRGSDDRPGIGVGKPPVLGWDASNVRGCQRKLRGSPGANIRLLLRGRTTPTAPIAPSRAPKRQQSQGWLSIRPGWKLPTDITRCLPLNCPDWPAASRLLIRCEGRHCRTVTAGASLQALTPQICVISID
jgi:hypothetical protein